MLIASGMCVNRSVKIYSMSRPQDMWVPKYHKQSRSATVSSSVHSMLEAMQMLWEKMNMPAGFVSSVQNLHIMYQYHCPQCILHLEDRLQALNEMGMVSLMLPRVSN